MKLSQFAAVPALLLATSAAFAQQPAPAEAVPPAPAAAPATVTQTPIDVATPPPQAPAVAPEQLPRAEEQPLAAKLGISKQGFWQPGALLQFWALGANQAGDTTTTMRVRRAELRLKGEIIPKLFGFNVMIDPARVLEGSRATLPVNPEPGSVSANNQGNVSIMQDYFLTFMSEYADVSFGQFKIPLSYEGYSSSSKVLLPERSVVSRRFGDQRDIGIKVDKKLGKHFYYFAALLNGEGQNKLDSNAQKDAALRLEFYPIDGVMLGAVGYAGLHNRDTTATTKDRLEADVKVELANFLLQAEYIHGWDGPTAVARTESAGVYAVLGYTFMDKIQPLVRIGHFDSNVRGNLPGSGTERGINAPFKDEVSTYELGLNYFLLSHDAKLQASWSKFVFPDQKNRGEVILAAQAAF